VGVPFGVVLVLSTRALREPERGVTLCMIDGDEVEYSSRGAPR
jgi:hypothetical protein